MPGLRKPVPLEPLITVMVIVLVPATNALAGTLNVNSALLPR